MSQVKVQLSLLDTEPKQRIILLSLREEYYKAMLDGTKLYEYRTRFLKEACTAYIYVSKTKKSIVGKVKFGQPIIGNAEQISRLADDLEPGCYDAMIEYLDNDRGFAIPVNEVMPLVKEIPLETIKTKFQDFVPPQSYYMLDKKPELFNFFKDYEEK